MAGLPRAPEQIVFSGGGLRCFWQGGFMEALCERRRPTPDRVAGVSGGALSAVGFLAGIERRLLEEMCAAFSDQDRNHNLFDPRHLFERGGHGITSHQQLYCEVVERVIDAAAEKRVADGPQLQILVAHPPDRRWPKLTGAAMTLFYEAELHLINAPHFEWAEKMGLTSTLVDANEAAREGRLADLVCAAAVIPPVFDPPDWDGRPVIDGGMADQAPMPSPDRGETLILLTRDYRSMPDSPRRHYVCPSEETPADKIDFTDPDKLRRTWDQGEADARRLLDAEEET
ncbi:patatin-like phospholipase family protein [Roseivivax isoporae]|uniref:Phospholipase n=1 Tax=Roseivivax isoporae LMG 25204 TaxID=1449351 RepID=X7FEX3_9RHOB|nr:patatin-like phospholipase family protein [Roseivivax isoporae]ETX30534.1 phospholipase [Roseivivax isoporae LMG 25204]